LRVFPINKTMATVSPEVVDLLQRIGSSLVRAHTDWLTCEQHIVDLKKNLNNYLDVVGQLIGADVQSLDTLYVNLRKRVFGKALATVWYPRVFEQIVVGLSTTDDTSLFDVSSMAAALKTFYANSVVHLWSLSKFLTFVDNNWLPPFRKLGPNGKPLVNAPRDTPEQAKAREARQQEARTTIRAALVGLTDMPKKQTELFQAVADSAAELANTHALPQGMQAAAQTWAKQAHLLLQATKAWACAYDSCKCRDAVQQFGLGMQAKSPHQPLRGECLPASFQARLLVDLPTN